MALVLIKDYISDFNRCKTLLCFFIRKMTTFDKQVIDLPDNRTAFIMNTMNRLIKIFFFTLATIMVQICYAQNEQFGTWKVSCPLEKMDIASISHCTICPMRQSKREGMTISTFEMTISHDGIQFNMNDSIITTKYTWDETVNGIEFDLNGKHFKFKVLSTVDKTHAIWLTDGRAVIQLERISKDGKKMDAGKS